MTQLLLSRSLQLSPNLKEILFKKERERCQRGQACRWRFFSNEKNTTACHLTKRHGEPSCSGAAACPAGLLLLPLPPGEGLPAGWVQGETLMGKTSADVVGQRPSLQEKRCFSNVNVAVHPRRRRPSRRGSLRTFACKCGVSHNSFELCWRFFFHTSYARKNLFLRT